MKEGGSVGVCKDTSSAADGCVNKKNRIYFFKNNNCTETDPWTPHFYHHILLRLTCFGYFCMGACLLCDCIWMYTLKISVHMMDVNPHKLGVLSLCVRPSGEIPSPPLTPVAVHIWLVCVICVRLDCEDERRWLRLCAYIELAKILHNPPQRYLACMCTHYSRVNRVPKNKKTDLSLWFRNVA